MHRRSLESSGFHSRTGDILDTAAALQRFEVFQLPVTNRVPTSRVARSGGVAWCSRSVNPLSHELSTVGLVVAS
jgi:hypothetical protein